MPGKKYAWRAWAGGGCGGVDERGDDNHHELVTIMVEEKEDPP